MNTAETSFAAGAFNVVAAAPEVVTGRITVDRWNLHFQSESLNLSVPLTRLTARIGEGEDDRIYFSDTEHPGWEVFTSDYAALEHPYLKGINSLRYLLSRDASRRELGRRIRMLGYVVVACVLLIMVGQWAVSAMVRSIVRRVPPSVEQELGDSAMKELRRKLHLIEDPVRVASLAKVAAPLVNTAGSGTNRLKFYISELPFPNAFALPGGHVIVTTGMLELTEKPEELLGVLSHELAHVTKRHGLHQLISSAGPLLVFRVFLGGGGSGVGAAFGQASELLVMSSFSKEHEAEADEVGWRSMAAANIDPRGMTRMFLKLKSYELSQIGLDDGPQAFASHPALDKRIANLEKRWQATAKKEGFQDLKALEADLKIATGH